MWTKTIPTEEGFYFFWGYVWGVQWNPDGKARLEVIEVRRISNGFIYTVHNAFVDTREAVGLWQRIPDPELPTDKLI